MVFVVVSLSVVGLCLVCGCWFGGLGCGAALWLFALCWSVFLLARLCVFLLSAFAFFGGILCSLLGRGVGSSGVVRGVGSRFGCRFWLLSLFLGVFLLLVRGVSRPRSPRVRSSRVSSVLLLPGFVFASCGRGWSVPVWSVPSPAPVSLSAPVPASAPAPLPAPVAPVSSASVSGSLLFLSSPAFVSAVSSGRCPVSVALSVFRWPLRSAVLGSLVRVLASRFVRSVVSSSPSVRSAARGFARVAVSALGFSVSGRFSSPACSRFLARLAVSSPVPPSFWCSGVSSGALLRAFRSLSSCLRWLSARAPFGRACPPALRPLLARLVWSLLPLV